jgi:hypothetical protein
MKIPGYAPAVVRRGGDGSIAARVLHASEVQPQSCDWLRCASAVAQCIRDPNPIECILRIAPACRDCL